MSQLDSDNALMELVNQLINSGSKNLVLPLALVALASHKVLEEIRQLCNLCGVKMRVED